MKPSRPITGIASTPASFWRFQTFGWSLYFAVYGFHLTLFRKAQWEDFLRVLLAMILGFLMSSLLRLYYRRMNIRQMPPAGLAGRLAGGSLVAGVAWFWTTRFVSLFLVNGSGAFFEWIRKGPVLRFLYPMFMDTVLFVIWSALYFTFRLWLDWDAERRQSDEARKSVQAHQFQMLCYQLNPHFLFNALNAVRALVVEDKQKAKRLVTDLSEFLRYSLVGREQRLVPLAREMEAVERVLSIERVRYEDKLDASIEMDPKAADYPVPAFFVNPLVENAVRHGIRTSRLPLRLSVSAMLEHESLRVTVCHSGRWNGFGDAVYAGGSGSKLHWLGHLLESAYPERHRLAVRRENGGVCIQIDLFKRMDAP